MVKCFNGKLSQGYTVAAACNYADSFNYNDNDVKHHFCYGDSLHNPMYYINASYIMNSDHEDREYTAIESEEDTLSTIKNYLQEKEGCTEEFELKETTNGTLIYDCVFNYHGVRTDYAYTFFIEDSRIKGYDNTYGNNTDIIREKIESFWKQYTDETIALRQTKEKELFLRELDGKIESLEQYIYFCAQEGRFYSALKYVAVDDEELLFCDTILFPIEE